MLAYVVNNAIELNFCTKLWCNNLVVPGSITALPKQGRQAVPISSLSFIWCLWPAPWMTSLLFALVVTNLALFKQCMRQSSLVLVLALFVIYLDSKTCQFSCHRAISRIDSFPLLLK
jgi:hypothetical protein